eukprot:1003476-Pleurochrysis_carterae.AAC.1
MLRPAAGFQVSAVIHHGGAGTTAAGLRLGKPTLVCPFFGDQAGQASDARALGRVRLGLAFVSVLSVRIFEWVTSSQYVDGWPLSPPPCLNCYHLPRLLYPCPALAALRTD